MLAEDMSGVVVQPKGDESAWGVYRQLSKR